MMCDIIYLRPHLEHTNNLVSLIFERRAVAKCKRFVTINYILLSVLSCKCFLVSCKTVSETPVHEHAKLKELVFSDVDF